MKKGIFVFSALFLFFILYHILQYLSEDSVTAQDNLARITESGLLPLNELAKQQKLSLEAPLLVNFWASWCLSCAREKPNLMRLQTLYGDNIQFLGIATHDNLADLNNSKTIQNSNYPLYFDADNVLSEQLSVDVVPKTFLFSAEGNILFQVTGPIEFTRLSHLTKKIKSLIDP